MPPSRTVAPGKRILASGWRYAREQFAQEWSVRQPADSMVELLRRNRFQLPEAERLGVEANQLRSQDSIALAFDRFREVTGKYPSSWMGWLSYADQLLHDGPLLGHSRDEAREAFLHALELNPNLIPVHEHLMLLALQDRDSAAAGRGLRELVRLDAGPGLTAGGYGDVMLNYRFLDAIIRGDSGLARRLADSVALDPAPKATGDGSFYDAFRFGFPEEQVTVSTRVLRAGSSPARREVHGRLLALAWAQRGTWDSALVAIDRHAKSGTDSSAALEAYGLAVVGSWLGAVDAREAESRRPAAVTHSQANASDRAEVAWLDGVTGGG